MYTMYNPHFPYPLALRSCQLKNIPTLMSARVYSDSVMVWEKDGEQVQGLDVSRWSEKRVQVDFSNRLVFYSLKKEDEGHYRCIVDLEIAAKYLVEGMNDLWKL